MCKYNRMTSYEDAVTPSEHLTGRVKWFNNKAGYGFVTVTDGSRSGMDIFVHHSDINVDNQQYKYLVQGEYIEFDLIKVDSGKHEWQASLVSGIRGGKLMCETRHDLKIARNDYKTIKGVDEPTNEGTEPKMPRQKSVNQEERNTTSQRVYSRVRGEGPRDSDNKKEWTLVANKGRDTRPRDTRPRDTRPRDTRPRNHQSHTVKSTQSPTIITIESK